MPHLALQQESLKGPLVIRTAEEVAPKPGQIQVQIKAAALNPADYKQFHYGEMSDKYPYIGGADSAGIVLAVGEGVTRFKKGDHVAQASFQFIEGPSAGGFQEITSAESTGAIKIPDSVSFTQAATIPVTFFTAWVALFQTLGLQPPSKPLSTPSTQAILIWGAGTGIGLHAIPLLHDAGYTNIIAIASSNRFELLKSLGAAATFDYHDADVIQQVQAYLADQPLLTVLDCITTTSSLTPVLKLVAKDGARVGTVTNAGKDLFEGVGVKRLDTVVPLIVLPDPEKRAPAIEASAYAEKLLAEGKFKFIPFQVLEGGLGGGGVQKGADMLRENKNHGDKIVIEI